jgi:TonB family protein
MKSFSRIVAGASVIAIAAAASPAFAQYANEYVPPKLVHKGSTSVGLSGNGTVKIQVQVNPDGTHKATKVLTSTNHGDDAAAMEIAQNSTYKPAERGGKPIPSFYDFTLKFSGSSVSAAGPVEKGAAGSVDALIRQRKYSDAVAKAQAALQNNPSDTQLNQMLGLAEYYAKDEVAAAEAFNKVSTPTKQYTAVAASSYATAAVKLAPTNSAQALEYAHKAVALDNSTNSHFSLGVAQLASKQYGDAITTLKGVHDKVSDSKVKLAVDRELLEAYIDTNDTAGASATSAEMKQLDPSANAGARLMGNHLLQAGSDALTAKNYDAALKNFDQAASLGDPQIAVTANTLAAFSIYRMDKPDYAKAKAYADKAVAGNPNDAQANFAEGIAYAGTFANSHSADDKKQALTYLNKADTLAKAAGNMGLSIQIEQQIKNVSQ